MHRSIVMCLPLFSLVAVLLAQNQQNDCFTQQNTVADLVQCLSKTWIRRGDWTFDQWKASLPSESERNAFKSTVKEILSSDENCEDIALPAAISGNVELRLFKNKYCVLHNKNIDASTGLLTRAWVFVIVPRKRSNRKNLVHHSSPHYEYDYNTGNESAAIFEQSDSYSLVISVTGRHSTLTKQNPCQPKYYPADGAHTNLTMFQAALLATWEWQTANGGCPWDRCAFIQWHGKKETSCPNDTGFISAGANNSSSIYRNASAPAVKLTHKIAARWSVSNPTFKVATPLSSSCNLVARTNVFGRVLNGNSPQRVCNTYANNVSGHFVHVEQAGASRNESQYNNWAQAVVQAFNRMPQNQQNDCFTKQNTVTDLVKCLSKTWIRRGDWTFDQWKASLPNQSERNAFKSTVKEILSSDENCADIALPEAIRDNVELRLFKNKYCVLHNKNVDAASGLLTRAWVFVIVPRKRSDRKNLVHHSSPHYEYDYNTGNESAAIFEQSESYSLVISVTGRHSTLTKQNPCQPKYYPADGAHTNLTMFHSALLATWEWQSANGGCPWDRCAFIQWHGMTSCPDTAFISAGANNSSSIYRNASAPAVKLTQQIAARWSVTNPQFKVATPLSSTCKLVARTNVFGRVLNGNSPQRVCNTYANNVSGHFVHVEQAGASRNESQYNNWAQAVVQAFNGN